MAEVDLSHYIDETYTAHLRPCKISGSADSTALLSGRHSVGVFDGGFMMAERLAKQQAAELSRSGGR
jgi:hypothetical protein